MGFIMTVSKSIIQSHKNYRLIMHRSNSQDQFLKFSYITSYIEGLKIVVFWKIRSSGPHLPKWKDTICFYLKNWILKILDIIEIVNFEPGTINMTSKDYRFWCRNLDNFSLFFFHENKRLIAIIFYIGHLFISRMGLSL